MKRLLRWGRVAGLAAVLVSAAGAGTSWAADHDQAAARVGLECPNTAAALIAGKRVCLKTGLACVRRFDAQYRRYGFSCPDGRLVRPFLIRDLGSLSGLGGSLDNAEINEQGQITGSVSGVDGSLGTPFLWQNGRLTRLGTTVGKALAINDNGQIVGWHLTAPNTTSAFLWQNGTMTDLSGLGGKSSGAYAINEQGQIVGYSRTTTGETHAVLWGDGTITDLGTLGGTESGAFAINSHGQVVGYSTTPEGARHAFLWQNGAISDLIAAARRIGDGTLNTSAFGINDNGQIVGNVWDANTDIPDITGAGVLWEAEKVTLIGSYWDGYADTVSSAVHAINAHGQIIGSTSYESQFPRTRAFLWQHGRTTPLGDLGGRFDTADALNDNGQVVGKSDTATGWSHACSWDNGVITDLATLGGKESEAFTINGRGQIAGASTTVTGQWHLVLWTAHR